MTLRLIFEATLIELTKTGAPPLKLWEFNYYANKAVNQYINKIYNIYDINQLTTDDLRVLKSTAYLQPTKTDQSKRGYSKEGSQFKLDVDDTRLAVSYLSRAHSSIQSLNGATYEVTLPQDYQHLLNCICIYFVAKLQGCYDAGSYIQVPAKRLTADSWSSVINDIYNRPTPLNPYYYLHNINTLATLPTNPGVTDLEGTYAVTSTNGNHSVPTEEEPWEPENSNFSRTFNLGDSKASMVEKPIATRVSNVSQVRMEIRYGKDDSIYQLAEVLVDYVKSPLFLRLTQELMDLTEDTSQMMEFPDYVNLEIINELVHLIMEKNADPRLQTNMLISQSIARPTQQLATPTLG